MRLTTEIADVVYGRRNNTCLYANFLKGLIRIFINHKHAQLKELIKILT